jgi:16S rRNA (guanine527-N7)-methyltransferase
VTPPTGPTREAVPAIAADVFGDRLTLATEYADLLCGPGVERGLIGPREPERIWERHLLNSAALAGAVADGDVVIDVGSGAGLPGIAVALARPEARVSLVEPMQRRAEFLREVVHALGLETEVVCARAEDLPGGTADVVLARAVAPLRRLLPLTLPLLRPAGTLLALKGRSAVAEVEQASSILRKWPAARVTVGTVAFRGAEAAVVRVDLSARAASRKAVKR